MTVNVLAAASQIAGLAARVAHPAGGRPCRLEDAAAVSVLLQALADGKSRPAAAKAAGVSEAVLRRWLKPGTLPAAACAELQRVVSGGALSRLRMSVPTAASVTMPADDTSAHRAPVVAAPVAATAPPPAKVYPAPPLERVCTWHERTERARRVSPTDPVTARWLAEEVQRELQVYGLSALPPAPAAWLPYGLPFDKVQARYIAWCQATGRPGPTDREVELEARRWYLDRRLPEITG